MTNNFKVIIIGGGPVGLTAAHALSLAGIDFILLEHRDSVTIDVGASLVLWPHGLRVMAQLGLLGQLQEMGTAIERSVTMTHAGYKYRESTATEIMQKNHGIPCRQPAFHRADLLSLLLRTLPESVQPNILTSKRVTNITTTPDNITAHCADGTTYTGSIIIGADGVHSGVRQTMYALSLESHNPNPEKKRNTSPKSNPQKKINPEKPFQAEYRTAWFTLPRPQTLSAGDTVNTNGRDLSVQVINGQARTWVFLYERLTLPTRERTLYSQTDIDKLATRCSDLRISDTLTVGDVFALRQTAGMTNLEEGILPHWSLGRIVLVGDACHKMTPNQGLGFNNGIQDVVVLVNELVKVLSARSDEGGLSEGGNVNQEILDGVFTRYQAARMAFLKKDYDASFGFVRMSAWQNWASKLMDRYILPAVPGFDKVYINRILSPHISEAQILDFVEGREPFEGRVPWKNRVKPVAHVAVNSG